MQKIYTSVFCYGNKILSRGYYENGDRFNKAKEYKPSLFVYSSKNPATDWTDIHDVSVYELKPGTIKDTREYLERYSEVEGYELLGMRNFVSQFISDEYKRIEHNSNHCRIFIFDIETATEGTGFPDITVAPEEILLISLWDSSTNLYHIFSAKEINFDTKLLKDNYIDEIVQHIYDCEADLLKGFVSFWHHNMPDVISGYNIQFFDLPYLLNRVERIIGSDYLKKFSPWGIIRPRKIQINGKDKEVYNIIGVNQLDYMDLMKKYTNVSRSSWKLDNVAAEELGRNKLEYDGSFKDFYTNDFDLYAAYNLVDVNLVKSLDDKMKLIDLAFTIAYIAKINPDEIFSQTRAWDNIIYNYLKDKHIVIPNEKNHRREHFDGGFVQEPVVGKHEWIVTLDATSLYPSLVMMFNISNDTITEHRESTTVDGLLEGNFDNTFLLDNDLSMTANGVMFRKDKRGFFPELMDLLFQERTKTKKKMIKLQQEYEETKNTELKNTINRYSNKQLALKVLLNSGYGAMACPYFRYFDLRMAEGITQSGQLGIRWVAKDINKFLNKASNNKNKNFILASDTDSVFVSLKDIVEERCQGKTTEEKIAFMLKFSNEIMQKVMNKSCNNFHAYMNSFEQKLHLKLEKVISSALILKKKRYALLVHNSEGVQYSEPKIKVTGLEIVRSSTPNLVKKELKECISRALSGSEKSIQQLVANYRKEYDKASIEEIAFPRGVNGLSTYKGSPLYKKGTPIHVRASLLYNHYLKRYNLENKYESIGEGSKMKFVFLKMPNPINENVVGFIDKLPKEFGLHGFVDYDMQYEKSFIDAVKSITEPLGWNTEEKSSLEDFF